MGKQCKTNGCYISINCLEHMKLSIITINYNNKAGLQKTIDSVICQTWKDYEWIIIDGGSTDGSKELIEQYQQHFSYWCSEPDNGVYNAMNKGIDKAQGEYLLFLNSGDVLYDEHVLQKVDDMHLDADIISGQVERMDNHQLLRTYDKSIFMQLFNDTLNHQGAFIKRALFDSLKYDENLKIVSDWKFWLETIIWRNASLEIVDLLVAKQDVTGISSDINYIDLQNREIQEVLDAFFPIQLQKELKEYQKLRVSPYAIWGNYLQKKSQTLYNIGYQVLKFLVKFV